MPRAKTPRRKERTSEEAIDEDERLTRFPASTYKNPSALFAALREVPPIGTVIEGILACLSCLARR